MNQQDRAEYVRLTWFHFANHVVTIGFVIFASAGYVLAKVIGNISIVVWDVALAVSLLLSLLIVNYLWGYQKETRGWKETLTSIVLTLIPFAILLPSFLSWQSPRILLSLHGGLHTGYALQILHGFSPPENPSLVGYPANDYWLYHALLAVVMHVLDIASPIAGAFLSIIALISSFGWIALLLNRIGVESKYSLVFGFLIMFGLLGGNLFAIIHVLANGKSLIDVHNKLNPNMGTMILAPADARIGNLLYKYLNFSGYPLGLQYYLAGLYGAAETLKARKFLSRDMLLLVSAGTGAVAFHTLTALVAVTTMPLAAIVALLITHSPRDYVDSLMKTIRGTIAEFSLTDWAVIAGVLVLAIPVAHYALSAKSAFPGLKIGLFPSDKNIWSNIQVSYPLWPLLALGIYKAVKGRKSAVLFLMCTAIVGMSLGVYMHIPISNQYKYPLFSGISASIGALWAVFQLVQLLNNRRIIAYGIMTIMFVLMTCNVLYLSENYLQSGWYLKYGRDYDFEGMHIVSKNTAGANDAYIWLRDHTALDSIIVSPPVDKNKHPVIMFAERLPYTAGENLFVSDASDAEKRLSRLYLIYSEDTTFDDRVIAITEIKESWKSRPLLILLPHNESQQIGQLLKLKILFTGQEWDVWELVPAAGSG